MVVAYKLQSGQVMLLLCVLPYWAPGFRGLFHCKPLMGSPVTGQIKYHEKNRDQNALP